MTTTTHVSAAPIYVSRDPYARETLMKTREHRGECAWCGAIDPARATDTERPIHRVYRFFVQHDSGRASWDDKTFCTRDCRNTYYEL